MRHLHSWLAYFFYIQLFTDPILTVFESILRYQRVKERRCRRLKRGVECLRMASRTTQPQILERLFCSLLRLQRNLDVKLSRDTYGIICNILDSLPWPSPHTVPHRRHNRTGHSLEWHSDTVH